MRRQPNPELEKNWNLALAYLSDNTRKYRYMYFALENPPDPNDENAEKPLGRNYFQVQRDIQTNVDLLKKWKETYDTKKKIEKDLQDLIQTKKTESINREEALYQTILDSVGINIPCDYDTLLGNTEKKETSEVSLITDNIAAMSTPQFWTAAVFNQFNSLFNPFNYEQLKSEDIFSLIISSDEFYKKLASKADTEIFSRTKVLREKYGDDDERLKELDHLINYEALDQFDLMFQDYLTGYVDQELANELNEVVSNLLNRYRGIDVKTGKKKKRKEVLATTFSKSLRDKIREVLDKYEKDGDSFEVKLKNSKGEIVLLVYSTKTKKEKGNLLYTQQFGVEEGNQLIHNIFKTFETAIRNMSNETLTIGNAGIFNINKYIKEGKTIQDFYKKGAEYCEKQQSDIKDILKSAMNKDSIYKLFKAENNNAYISALLGELSAKYKFSTLLNKEAKLSGSTHGRAQGFNYGQSVNDIRAAFTPLNKEIKFKNRSFGVNVKNYVVSAQNQITLYSSKSPLSVWNQTMNKYLTAEETNLLQFCAANSGYFDNLQQIKDITYSVVLRHIPEFLRVYDHSQGSTTNLFYQINHVVYPASYIYQCVLEQIKYFADRSNKDSAFFKINVKGRQTEPFIYNNLQEAREDWTRSKFRLGPNSIGKNLTDITVKTNGLSVNLVSLSLF